MISIYLELLTPNHSNLVIGIKNSKLDSLYLNFFIFIVTNNLIHLCDESNAELLANFSENSNPRIVAWNPSIDYAYAFAVNLPNHKIQLIKLIINFLKINIFLRNYLNFFSISFNLHKKKSSKIVDIQKEFCKNL